MKILTLDAHEQVAVADILVAVGEVVDGKPGHVVLYGLAKTIATSFEDEPVIHLIRFLDDLKNAALVCHAQPASIPPTPEEMQ